MIVSLARAESLRKEAEATDSKDSLQAALKEKAHSETRSDLKARTGEVKALTKEVEAQADEIARLRAELGEAEEKRLKDIGLALKEYWSSTEFQEELGEYALAFYEAGFNLCKSRAQKLYLDLDFKGVEEGDDVPAEDQAGIPSRPRLPSSCP